MSPGPLLKEVEKGLKNKPSDNLVIDMQTLNKKMQLITNVRKRQEQDIVALLLYKKPKILEELFSNIQSSDIENEDVRKLFDFILSLKDNYDINKIDISNNYKVEENIEVQNVKCEICLNEYNGLNPKNYFLQCGCIAHDECFEAFITNSILEGNINVLCPLCKKGKITYNLIYQVLNATKQDELKEIFKKLAPNKKGALFQRLVCPNIKCAFSGKGAVEGSKFTCPECKNEYCISCDEYWHIGYTCEEFKSKQKMIKDSVSNFLAIAKNRYKQCPKCHIWIDFEIQCEKLFCICGYKFELNNNYNNY